MSIPNIGPEHADSGDREAGDTARRGNLALVYREEPSTDVVAAASARASTVTHRFGGVRYALSRAVTAVINPKTPAEERDTGPF